VTPQQSELYKKKFAALLAMIHGAKGTLGEIMEKQTKESEDDTFQT